MCRFEPSEPGQTGVEKLNKHDAAHSDILDG